MYFSVTPNKAAPSTTVNMGLSGRIMVNLYSDRGPKTSSMRCSKYEDDDNPPTKHMYLVFRSNFLSEHKCLQCSIMGFIDTSNISRHRLTCNERNSSLNVANSANLDFSI